MLHAIPSKQKNLRNPIQVGKRKNAGFVLDVPKVLEIEQATEEYCKKYQVDRDPTITCCAFRTEHNRVDMGKCQGEVARKNKMFKMKDVKMLMEKALANITVEEWVNAIKHTEKGEEEYQRMDFCTKCPLPLH